MLGGVVPHRPTAAELDAADPLGQMRERFAFPDPHLVYLDGNSLGRLPADSSPRVRETVDREWGDRLIRSWNESWWDAPTRIGDAIAPLIGARPGEVAIADSTSVNLFKLAVAALDSRSERGRILTDDLNFPSDLYVLEAAARRADGDHHVEVVGSPDGVHGPIDELLSRLDDDVALVSLSLVTYASGYWYDLDAITRKCQAVGALILWDLSHAAGAVPIDLDGAGVDLAVGCTYKYLNAGPGAPAFLHVRADLQQELSNPVTGWLGHRRPFDLDITFSPDPGIRRFLTGTPPIVSMATIEPGVALIRTAGMHAIRLKSVAQTGYLIERWEADLAPLGFSLRSPRDPARRGSHVSLGHRDALGIDLALIEDFGVIPDFRPPDNIRLGVTPLTTSYVDIDRAVEAMRTIVAEGRHVAYRDARPTVT